MKKITRLDLIKYSPFILLTLLSISFIGQLIKEGYHNSNFLYEIIGGLFGCFFLPPVIWYFSHKGSKYQTKTGRSFRSDDGMSFDEVETKREYDKEMDPTEKRIMMKYFKISLLILPFALAFK